MRLSHQSGAVTYRHLGRRDDARRVYAEALPIFRSLGDSREQARCLGNLARLEAANGHDAAALDDFDRALRLFRTLADPPQTAWTLEGKAQVLRRRGDLAAARGLMEEALEEVERHRYRQTSYTTRAEFFGTRQDSYDFLIDLLMEMHREAPAAGYAAAALEASERSLARSLLDGLAAGGGERPSGQAWAGLALGFAGLMILARPWEASAGGGPDPLGVGALLFASMTWAWGSIRSRRMSLPESVNPGCA